MPSFQVRSLAYLGKTEPDCEIIINGVEVPVQIQFCKKVCKKLRNLSSSSKMKILRTFTIDGIDMNKSINDLTDFFGAKRVMITTNNLPIFYRIAEFFEIEKLSHFLSKFISDQTIISKYFLKNPQIEKMCMLENAILNIKVESNIDKSIYSCISFINEFGQDLFLRVACKIGSTHQFITFSQLIDLFIQLNNTFSDLISNLTAYIANEIKHSNRKPKNCLIFILHELYLRNLVSVQTLKEIFKGMDIPYLFIDALGFEGQNLSAQQKMNLTENNFEDHKKQCSEGHSNDPLLSMIRNDDINQLQDCLLFIENFSPLNPIGKSYYEKSSFINDGECNLIQYAAYFGAKNCFKYFITSFQNIEYSKIAKYAVAGGNAAIIYEFKDMANITFKNTVNVAVKHHLPNIVSFLMNNKYDIEEKLSLITALSSYSFASLLEFVKNGFILKDYLFGTIISINHPLLKDCLHIFAQQKQENDLLNKLKKFVLLPNLLSINSYLKNFINFLRCFIMFLKSLLYTYNVFFQSLWNFMIYLYCFFQNPMLSQYAFI